MKRILNIGGLCVILFCVVLSSCQQKKADEKLPILGRIEVDSISGDSIYHSIADFELIDQDSNAISQKDFENTVYVADFFFTSCPDICPLMKTQMLRIYEAYSDRTDIKFLSHTIDPSHDTPAVLKDFSERLEIDNVRWKFVTGDIDYIYKLGQTSYMASMANDPQSGFIHSGRFFLVDKERHIRGAYDGTSEMEVDVLIQDIKKLMKEYE